jgi:aryl-alcohol dehydrogenase-like predicted oxidoreductase
MVQAPFSMLDRRYEGEGTLAALMESGVDFYARSVFLQGAIFLSPQALEKKLPGIRQALGELQDEAEGRGVEVGAAALGFVLLRPDVKGAVIGVETPEQLAQCLFWAEEGVMDQSLTRAWEGRAAAVRHWLDPRNWESSP